MSEESAAFERGFVAGWRARERETALEQSARERDRLVMQQAQQWAGQASPAQGTAERVRLTMCSKCGLLSMAACGLVDCPMPPGSRPA